MNHSTSTPSARPCGVIHLNQYRKLSPLHWRRARGLMTWMDCALEYRQKELLKGAL